MYALLALSFLFIISLSFISAYIRRDEIIKNWTKYRDNPLYIFAAPLFKPDDDPRSRLKFASDNFVDVINGFIMRIFAVFLQPVMKIVQLLTGSLEESAGGIMNMRGVLGNMYKKFNSVVDIFMRRYNNTFHSLRITWVKLHESLKKTFGVAVSALYAGVSAFRGIDNMFRLMTIVSIVILSILLGFVVFFFFLLWPLIPLILVTIGFISQTPYASEVSGMGSAFCFSGDTKVATLNGIKTMKEIKIGTVLIQNGVENKVTAKLEFKDEYESLYDLYGVQVSGSHIYLHDGIPIFVKDHPDAKPNAISPPQVYCLITENHTIPVISNKGIIVFADWEEISKHEDLLDWHKIVFSMLNPNTPYSPPNKHNLNSESAISEKTYVVTPLGPLQIRHCTPGMKVYDSNNDVTTVNGIVKIHCDEVDAAVQLDTNTFISAGTWIHTEAGWKMPSKSNASNKMAWYQLFTTAGTFRILTSDFKTIAVRDFSDVGSENIEKTYDWVLTTLASQSEKGCVH
jgi:hypothetical protein